MWPKTKLLLPAKWTKVKVSSYQPFIYRRQHHLSHYDTKSIVIASAVRTPWVEDLCRHFPSATTTHLCTTVLEAAVRQSAAPLEQLQTVYMAGNGVEPTEGLDKLRFGELLKKSNHILVGQSHNDYLKTLLMGIDDLKEKKLEFSVVGTVQLKSPQQLSKHHQENSETFKSKSTLFSDYVSHCRDLHMSASGAGIFDAELVPLKLLKQDGSRRTQFELTEDIIGENFSQDVNGAAATVLTTMKTAEKYNLKPLASIEAMAVQEIPNTENKSTAYLIDSMLQKHGVPVQAVQQWQLNLQYQEVFDMQTIFQLPWNTINPYGFYTANTSVEFSNLLGTVTHMAHTIRFNEYGCIVSRTPQYLAAVMLKKLPAIHPTKSIPNLTLFTKDDCHLCDLLLDELDCNFAGEYELEKVFIDRQENVRYLRLYRHDIPVLFLNGQYLCMHRLNVRLLRRKLDLLKEMERLGK